MTRLQVRTASRLHFGLLGWGPGSPRQFGGVGLMIQDPGIEIRVEPATAWSFEGPLSQRVGVLVRGLLDQQAGGSWCGPRLAPARVTVISAPPEHVGLGVGTQLSLAVVRALLEFAGAGDSTAETLGRLADRGRRSGIGIHGFVHGGLIVDGGRRTDDVPPPLVARVPFPEDWSILLVQPPGPRGRHGTDEARAFAELPPLPDRIIERLCRLVLLGIIPAAVQRDLDEFGEALAELQHQVGSAFAPWQGGLFASAMSASLISQMRDLGLSGAGQSSWGPTLYAFGSLTPVEKAAVASRLLDRSGLDPSALRWTRAANHGAILDRAET
jgi:beta-RFAP synthase